MRSVGIYPGAFDPLHDGHIAFANAALDACNLESVYIVPETYPRHKPSVTSVAQRTRLITLQLASPRIHTLALQSSPFTPIATLDELRHRLPHSTFTLLIGSDIALGMEAWPDLITLLFSCRIAIGVRSEHTTQQLIRYFSTLSATHAVAVDYTLIETDHSHLASSQLRTTT